MTTSHATQVVILAGGLGTRLRPITEKCPKPMVTVSGLPFLRWQLEDVRLQGFSEILLLVSYLGEQIESYFGDGESFGLKIRYSYEKEPLGTGGALKNAESQLHDEFILLNGDSFLRAPLSEMLRVKNEGGFQAVVSVYDNRVPVPVIPNLKISGDLVLDYKKDAKAGEGFTYIDSGIYAVDRQLLERHGPGRFMLADLWQPLLSQGKFGAFSVSERFYDIGTRERLKEFEEKVRDYFPNTISH